MTNKGKQVFSTNLFDRQKEFVKLIVSHSAFKQTLKQYLENGVMPNKATIVEIMGRSKLFKVTADSTYFRKASTIVGWANWIVNQIEE